MNQHTSANEKSAVVQRGALAKRHRRLGPAIPIAIGTTIGGLTGLFGMGMKITPVGMLLMFLGSLAGGFYYRFRSAGWPVDPNARRRRRGLAVLAAILPPSLTAIAAGLRGQGFAMTVLTALIGLAVATGVLVSGDRRSGNNTA